MLVSPGPLTSFSAPLSALAATPVAPQFSLTQISTTTDYEESPLPTSERSARTAVIAYMASFFTGMPFQVGPEQPARVVAC